MRKNLMYCLHWYCHRETPGFWPGMVFTGPVIRRESSNMSIEIRPIEDAPEANGGADEPHRSRHWAWREDDLILSLDIVDEEFIVEWYTTVEVETFIEKVATYLEVSPESRATCQFRPEDREMLEDVPFGQITDHDRYPDRCTYLELNPEERSWSVAWTLEDPDPTITFRGSRDNMHLLVELMFRTLDSESFSEDDIMDAISVTHATITRKRLLGENSIDRIDLEEESSENNDL